jgi:hypothetical protein
VAGRVLLPWCAIRAVARRISNIPISAQILAILDGSGRARYPRGFRERAVLKAAAASLSIEGVHTTPVRLRG